MSEDTATVEFSAEAKELGDKIAGLTLKQAKELSDYLKDEHGIEPAAGGAVVMAGGGGGGILAQGTFLIVTSNPTRIRSALTTSGYDYPASQRVVVNLVPVIWDKDSSAFDLPIALARTFNMPVQPTRIALDGGALLSNGAGLCIASTKLLEENGRKINDLAAVQRFRSNIWIRPGSPQRGRQKSPAW